MLLDKKLDEEIKDIAYKASIDIIINGSIQDGAEIIYEAIIKSEEKINPIKYEKKA